MTDLKSSIRREASICPHDCPSSCSLEVEVLGPDRIGRIRGAESNSYTAGVVCAKVARYAERVHHPDRLLHPLIRMGAKGEGRFARIDWDEALDMVAARFDEAEKKYGSETVWPYYYAGTMGRVQRDGINRLRNRKRYSGQFSTICTTPAWTGFIAGTGKLMGADPREMAKSDCVVIWGTNPVHTQVNVMTHALRARKERGAKLVVVDIYNNATMAQADMPLVVRPGTDGALACAVMHVLFRDGLADWDYLDRYADCPRALQEHLADKTPHWAEGITGLSAEKIEAFAQLVGGAKRSFFRIGYGLARQRNGAVNLHGVSCIPVVTGAWAHEGGGAFHSNSGVFGWNSEPIEGRSHIDPAIRKLDQSRIGPILTGDREALKGGPPVTAMLIQNTNPAVVAPDQTLVRRGFLRDDLFTCVHEQFLTDTAQLADIVLPATTFVEHDDIYSSGGQQTIQCGLKLIDPPGECRSNHEVIAALAERLGVSDEGFTATARELIDHTLGASGHGSLAELEAVVHRDIQPPFEVAHYRNGFAHADGRFHFRVDWTKVPNSNAGLVGPWQTMPSLPDHWPVIEEATAQHPYRLATSPARNFLNSSFTETPTSLAKEKHPKVMVSRMDAEREGIAQNDWVELSNERGSVFVRAEPTDIVLSGVLIVEGIWPNRFFPHGRSINTLTGADSPAPYGGAAVHDSRVALRKCSKDECGSFN